MGDCLDKVRAAQAVRCDVRCWRVGAPAQYVDGVCDECGAPEPEPGPPRITTVEAFRELAERAGAEAIRLGYHWADGFTEYHIMVHGPRVSTIKRGPFIELRGPDLQAVLDAAAADVRGWMEGGGDGE